MVVPSGVNSSGLCVLPRRLPPRRTVPEGWLARKLLPLNVAEPRKFTVLPPNARMMPVLEKLAVGTVLFNVAPFRALSVPLLLKLLTETVSVPPLTSAWIVPWLMTLTFCGPPWQLL